MDLVGGTPCSPEDAGPLLATRSGSAFRPSKAKLTGGVLYALGMTEGNDLSNVLLASIGATDLHVPVIAEIGINHNGDLKLAERMIREAKSAGCDFVKFQKRDISIVYSQEVLDSPRESPWGTTQREQKAGLEFDATHYEEIANICAEVEIGWTASAWDLQSLRFVENFAPPFHKVASAMITNREFVVEVAKLGRPTLVSTGMCDWDDVDFAVETLVEHEVPFGLFHTVSTYPMDETAANLRMIQTLKDRYGCPVGYSGHEATVSVSIFAVALGAMFVERHFTVDRTMYGSDQAASLEPRGMRELVSVIGKFPSTLGDGEKIWAPGEREVASKLRYW